MVSPAGPAVGDVLMSKIYVLNSAAAGVFSCLIVLSVGACGGNTSADPDITVEDKDKGQEQEQEKPDVMKPEPVMAGPMCDDPEGTDPDTLDDAANACAYFCIPNEQITDFTADAWRSKANPPTWGRLNLSLTGNRFTYQGPETKTVMETHDAEASTLVLSGVTSNYVGWGLAFGPCTNASRFSGIELTAFGDLGGASLTLQVQDNNNMPIDGQQKRGACVPASNATKYEDCKNNEVVVEGLGDTSTSIKIPFEDIVGGSIFSPVDPEELYGIQLQVGCGMDEAPCAYELTLEKIAFY